MSYRVRVVLKRVIGVCIALAVVYGVAECAALSEEYSGREEEEPENTAFVTGGVEEDGS